MEKVKMDDFTKIISLSEVNISPDGKTVAFVCCRADEKDNSYKSNIWLYEKGAVRKLTAGDNDTGIVWLDEEHLLFPGDRKKAHKPEQGQAWTVYNRISIYGGEAEEYFAVPKKCKRICPISDGEFLLIAVDDLREEPEAEKEFEIIDEIPFWSNGTGMINKKRTRLYLFNRESKSLRLLSPEWMNVAGFDYDKAGDRVVYFGSDYQELDEKKADLYVRCLHSEDGKDVIKIDLEHKYAVESALWNGDQIYVAASDWTRFGAAENPCQFLADPAKDTWKQIGDLNCSMGSSVGSDVRHGGGKSAKVIDGDWYFSSTRGFATAIVRLSAKGEESMVSPQGHASIDCWDYGNGAFYYVAMARDGLQELYRWNPGTDEAERLTHFNDAYLAEHTISPVKPLSFTDADGVEIDGWVMEPVGFDPAGSYPAILNVHGGPKTVYGEVFYHEMQLWANEGYFVFFCNPRGGDGKGNEFADIYGKNYGVKDYQDLMEFTDRVLETYPQIDRARVGMTGGSYGGYMANWIVGHTDRFAAVASQRSISNFVTKCLTSDIGYYYNMTALQCDPWSNVAQMWNCSPLKYADKCKTPTLFIQADEDYRCWMTDAIQMFTALKLHGCPARMCLFHGENHELSRNGKPRNRIRRLKEITDWFDAYLKV